MSGKENKKKRESNFCQHLVASEVSSRLCQEIATARRVEFRSCAKHGGHIRRVSGGGPAGFGMVGDDAKNITTPWHLEQFRESRPGAMAHIFGPGRVSGKYRVACARRVCRDCGGCCIAGFSEVTAQSGQKMEANLGSGGYLAGPVSRGRRRGPRHWRVTIRRFVSAFFGLVLCRRRLENGAFGYRYPSMLTSRREEYCVVECFPSSGLKSWTMVLLSDICSVLSASSTRALGISGIPMLR